MLRQAACFGACAVFAFLAAQPRSSELERGWRNPPQEARPHAYWLWLNGYVDPAAATEELQAMKDAGFGGVLLFDMGARGEKSVQPPAGPAFLSPPWMKQFRESVTEAKQLGLQVDFSVISSWDLGGHWIEPKHGSMGLYSTETSFEGAKRVDVALPFPPVPPAAPKAADGKPAFWRDVAVLAVRDAQRRPGHEFVFKLDPEGLHELREVVLDNGNPKAPAAVAASMTPVREFSVEISSTGIRDGDFREVIKGALPASAGPQRFPVSGKARFVRLRLLSGHDSARPRWTLGEFSVIDAAGTNVAAARVADTRRNGAMVVRGTAPLGYDQEWNQDNLHDGDTEGARGVFASAGPPPFAVSKPEEFVDLTSKVGTDGRLRWEAPAGRWTVLRYTCMNTGERLKVPSPASDGWATDHLNPEATRAHMDYVIARLKESFGDVAKSGLKNLYLASYEVRGQVWSPGFAAEFRKLRGYDMTPYLPAIFGARVVDDNTTDRFLFDYRKTLGEVLIDAYYVAAREAAHKAGLTIKSEAGGPGPPVHNVPVDALLANNSVDEIQGEFWPFWPNADGLWVVKETATSGHMYGKRVIHLEAFTSFEGWREGPQDLKPSADRVFCEGGNHMVWHTWSHAPAEAGKPGWVYLAGTHINRNIPWWPKVRPFIDYLSRSSYMLQRGNFVGDVLYYYGDGGYKFVGPRRNPPSLGPGYDYDVTNSDVILNRLSVRDGRLTLPDGTSYAVLVLPESEEAHPAVLAKIEKLVAAGATVIGPKPQRAVGLEGYPASDQRVREIAARLWDKGLVKPAPVRQVLLAKGIEPDFVANSSLDFIHRRDGDAEIYFVRNKTGNPVSETVRFRAANREPELWNPVSGQIAVARGYKASGKFMEVPLELAANGSVFVVFRGPARQAPPVKPAARELLSLAGEWSVEFEKQGRVELPRLQSWTEHSDANIRYFAGTARYRKTFNAPAGVKGQRVSLDLGNLWAVGEAWLNGKPLGIVWTAPFRLDCTEALREGSNELAVEVTTNWYNRLIGDAGKPASERITRTNVTTSGGKPWAKLDPLPSGLFGPVRLIAERP